MQSPESKPTPQPPKGPYERRGSIPRERFSELFKWGPYSMDYSRNKGREERKKMGEEILKERFSRHYGREISGGEIKREIGKLRVEMNRAQTGAEKGKIKETIVRLEEAKKRAGL